MKIAACEWHLVTAAGQRQIRECCSSQDPLWRGSGMLRASGISQCQDDFLESAWQTQRREIRMTRARDTIAAGALRSSLISSSCYQPSLPASKLPGGCQPAREERRNPGSCCFPPRWSTAACSQALEWHPWLWIAAWIRIADLSCCQGVEKLGCAAEGWEWPGAKLEFPWPCSLEEQSFFQPFGNSVSCHHLCCSVLTDKRPLLNIPRICLSLNHRV